MYLLQLCFASLWPLEADLQGRGEDSPPCHPNKCTFNTATGARVKARLIFAPGALSMSMSTTVCSVKEDGERTRSAGLHLLS